MYTYGNFSAFFLWSPLGNYEKKVVWISSNLERLHEIKKEAYAENLSCLSHWEPRNLPRPPQLWARWSDPFGPLIRLFVSYLFVYNPSWNPFSGTLVFLICSWLRFGPACQILFWWKDASVKKKKIGDEKRQHFVHRIPISSPAFSDSSMILLKGKGTIHLRRRHFSSCCCRVQKNLPK